MGVRKLYDDPRGQRGRCTLAVCMVGSPAPRAGVRARRPRARGGAQAHSRVVGSYRGRGSGGADCAKGAGWRGTGGEAGCAAWLQVGGMVLTVVGVMVGPPSMLHGRARGVVCHITAS